MLVFVYGTLCRGDYNHHHLAGAQYQGPGVTESEFELYDLGTYPGAVRGTGQVIGEIYAVDREILERLDRLEGHPGFYRRELISTRYGPAWFYLYRGAVENCARIESGDWRRWRHTDAELIHYFAYGSNMALARLQQRVPSAAPVSAGRVIGHQLRFHKLGSDGSGKCDLFATGCDAHEVHGVLYRFDISHKPALDAAEGLGYGYEEKSVEVQVADGQRLEAWSYYAIRIRQGLQPWDWYKNFVVEGARQSGLPTEYIAALERIPALRDPDEQRRQQSLQIMRQNGTAG